MENDRQNKGLTRREFATGAGAVIGAMAMGEAATTSASAQETAKTGKQGSLLMSSVWLHERSWEGVQENLKTNDTVIIPIGSIENHGVHSPLMTDTCWALGVAEGVARATGIICGPPVYAAYSRGHMAYPGSVNIRGSVLSDYIIDIGRSMLFHGYRRIVLVNGHRVSNLAPILVAGNHLHHRYGVPVGIIDAGLVAYKEVAAIVSKEKGSEHGGDAETSMVLAYRPDLVDMSKAGNQPPCPNGQELEDFMTEQIMLFAPNGDNAEASKEKDRSEFNHGTHMASSRFATVEKGRQIWDVVIKHAVAAVEEFKKRKVELKNMEDVYPI